MQSAMWSQLMQTPINKSLVLVATSLNPITLFESLEITQLYIFHAGIVALTIFDDSHRINPSNSMDLSYRLVNKVSYRRASKLDWILWIHLQLIENIINFHKCFAAIEDTNYYDIASNQNRNPSFYPQNRKADSVSLRVSKFQSKYRFVHVVVELPRLIL